MRTGRTGGSRRCWTSRAGDHGAERDVVSDPPEVQGRSGVLLHFPPHRGQAASGVTLDTVAASSSADARGSQAAERYRLLRELGARAVPTRAALDAQTEGKSKVVVAERIVRGGVHGDQDIADWVRDARRLATLEHPNVVRVRDVVIRGEDVMVVGDFVDGVRWTELVAATPRPTVDIALRVLVDVLTGLSAIHNLRDAKREPLKLVHGELTPDCVIVGLDGIARIASTCRLKSATARPGRDGSAYLAPEVLLADESTGPKADVYSVGVMLWEALSGKPLFPNTQPSAIVTHLLSGKVAKPTIPEGAPWAAPLAEVVAGAMAANPEKRFASAAALGAELRRIAGTKLASAVRVAGLVRGTFGDRIRQRREALERGEAARENEPGREVSGVEPPPLESDVLVESIRPDPIPSTAPTPLPPEPGAVATADIPPEAIKPPPLPGARARLPTLSGVAPPTEIEPARPVQGTRVVVAPPTPMVAFAVPGLALQPPPAMSPAAAMAPAPGPAAAFVVTPPPITAAPLVMLRPAMDPDDAIRPAQRSKRVVLIALVATLLLGITSIVWCAASSSSRTVAAGPTATGSATAAAQATATPVATATEPTAEPTPAAPSPSAAATATPDGTSSTPPTAAAAPPAVAQPPQPWSPFPQPRTTGAPLPTTPRAWHPGAATPPPAATRPGGKRKYEPEGI